MRNAITLAGCFTVLRPRGPVLDDADAARAKTHRPEHLGIAGRRVLVSRKWSVANHRAERGKFVR